MYTVVMKTESFAKLFFLISFTGLIMYAILAFYSFHTAYTTVSDYETYHTHGFPNKVSFPPVASYDTGLKYTMVWTIPIYNINNFGEGQEPFIKYNCAYSNCYLTTQGYLLNDDYRNFDAILLDVGVVRRLRNVTIPHYRYPAQRFVFHSMKSANETPICPNSTDNYFNWTWTYRLSSDIVTPYIEVVDLEGNAVAPKPNVYWSQNLMDLTEKIVEKLQTKKKAVAWVMDTCKAQLHRMEYVKRLKDALAEHSLVLDIFVSGCGKQMCPNDDCMKVIESDYYYYLAYERSHAKDYVTDEVLKGYDNYAVPIVKGGADYRLFLPEGSYLDASRGSVQKLATIIEYSIRNTEVYYNFHRWRTQYIIRQGAPERGLCDLCQKLNLKSKVPRKTYKTFRKWWYDGPLAERCLPKGAERMVDVWSYLNSTRKGLKRKQTQHVPK